RSERTQSYESCAARSQFRSARHLFEGCGTRSFREGRTRADSTGARFDSLEPETSRSRIAGQLQITALQDQTDRDLQWQTRRLREGLWFRRFDFCWLRLCSADPSRLRKNHLPRKPMHRPKPLLLSSSMRITKSAPRTWYASMSGKSRTFLARFQ